MIDPFPYMFQKAPRDLILRGDKCEKGDNSYSSAPTQNNGHRIRYCHKYRDPECNHNNSPQDLASSTCCRNGSETNCWRTRSLGRNCAEFRISSNQAIRHGCSFVSTSTGDIGEYHLEIGKQGAIFGQAWRNTRSSHDPSPSPEGIASRPRVRATFSLFHEDTRNPEYLAESEWRPWERGRSNTTRIDLKSFRTASVVGLSRLLIWVVEQRDEEKHQAYRWYPAHVEGGSRGTHQVRELVRIQEVGVYRRNRSLLGCCFEWIACMKWIDDWLKERELWVFSFGPRLEVRSAT